ncbi:MAG TPA: BlaI/MecI/CopY family transcriptional regulator [Thermoplasmata archaeon]|nr:BlaI/MecI/CopY family transcriptional regulator [Thermoplasmata archaeon]
MELGELELAVLKAVRTLGEASPGEIHREVKRGRDVAYTSVTTTLYRLVAKELVASRRESEKRIFYRIKEGRAYNRALATMVDRLVTTFGPAAVSHLLERPSLLTEAERADLEARIAERRSKE